MNHGFYSVDIQICDRVTSPHRVFIVFLESWEIVEDSGGESLNKRTRVLRYRARGTSGVFTRSQNVREAPDLVTFHSLDLVIRWTIRTPGPWPFTFLPSILLNTICFKSFELSTWKILTGSA